MSHIFVSVSRPGDAQIFKGTVRTSNARIALLHLLGALKRTGILGQENLGLSLTWANDYHPDWGFIDGNASQPLNPPSLPKSGWSSDNKVSWHMTYDDDVLPSGNVEIEAGKTLGDALLEALSEALGAAPAGKSHKEVTLRTGS